MIEKFVIDYNEIEELSAYLMVESEELQGQYSGKADQYPDESLFLVIESPRLRRYWRVLTTAEIEEEYFKYPGGELRRKDSPKVEWRRIPGYPGYQINADGDVRNWETGKILTERYFPFTGAYAHTLWVNGKSCSRNFKRLLYLAWPELYSDWRPLPGWPTYLISRNGEVMSERFLKPITKMVKGAKEYPYYQLRRDGKRHIFKLSDVNLDEIFADSEEKAA
jgi:hypothetical protein